MRALLYAASIAVTVAASCTGTVIQEDSPAPASATPSRTADPSPFQVSDAPEPSISLAGTSWLLAIMDGGDVQVGDAPDITLVFHHADSSVQRLQPLRLTGGEGVLVLDRSD